MPDFIQSGDDDYNEQLNAFTEYVLAHLVALSVTTDESLELDAVRQGFSVGLTDYKTSATATASLCVVKDDARAASEALMRKFNKRFQANPTVTDSQKTEMHLNVPDGTRTRAAVPTTRPVAQVKSGGPLEHILIYRDETTPGSKAKPPGIVGAEVRCAIVAQGAPVPTDPAAYLMLAQESSPHLVEQDDANIGKMACYRLRWVNSHNEKGPWSETVTAMIAG